MGPHLSFVSATWFCRPVWRVRGSTSRLSSVSLAHCSVHSKGSHSLACAEKAARGPNALFSRVNQPFVFARTAPCRPTCRRSIRKAKRVTFCDTRRANGGKRPGIALVSLLAPAWRNVLSLSLFSPPGRRTGHLVGTCGTRMVLHAARYWYIEDCALNRLLRGTGLKVGGWNSCKRG